MSLPAARIGLRAVSRAAPRQARSYATESPAVVVGTPAVRKPVGGFRGSLAGFLLGFGAASAYGYYYLLQEYHAASNLLLTSVEELQGSTQKITSRLAHINKLEADLKALTSSSATKADLTSGRGEMKKVYDGLHEEVLGLRQRLWGVEKDLNSALKSSGARGVVGAPPAPAAAGSSSDRRV